MISPTLARQPSRRKSNFQLTPQSFTPGKCSQPLIPFLAYLSSFGFSFLFLGMKSDDYICIFKLDFNKATGLIEPVLINTKQLKGKLMKAITSTKFSSTGRFVLVGYGVRSAAGVVEDHEKRYCSCLDLVRYLIVFVVSQRFLVFPFSVR
jgi:hypothetical protein